MLLSGWMRRRAIGTLYGVSFHSDAPPNDDGKVVTDVLIFVRWAHEICTKDHEERAIVVASMNELAYVFQAWLPLIIWQQVEAPEYQKGFITVSCLSFLLIVVAFVIRALQRR